MKYSSSGFSLKDLTEFLPKTITQLYGPAASGKSNICLCAATKTALSGKRVVFIDTEGSFSHERVRQIAGKDTQKVMKNIVLAEPSDFDEQKIAINKLDEVVDENFGLVIVDSFVSLYRLEIGNSEDPYTLNRELGRQLSRLLKLSKKRDIPVIITNQVYQSFEKGGRGKTVLPVGRDLLRYWSKVIISLEKGENRTASLIRHKFKPGGSVARFSITDTGIE